MAALNEDDHIETNFSTIDQTASSNVQMQPVRNVMSSGDEIRSTDDDILAAAQPTPFRRDRTRNNSQHKLHVDSVVRVKAGDLAKETAVARLLKSSEKSKFIFAVNNMTDHNLVRSASSGSDSWPFCSIPKNECVAALFDHSQFENLNVLFTADDDQVGIRTVMLCAHWTENGRGIRIYAGKTQANSEKIDREKIHDHESDRNKAVIINPGSCYVFGYDVNELQYAQFAVTAGNEAGTEAIRKFTNFCTGSMPGFAFIVNNLTGYNLTLAEKHDVQGTWPLGNIKKGECAVAGFDQLNMSLAARYTATVEDLQKNSISLAGSWPFIGSRKIYVGEGMKAKDAWKNLSRGNKNWPVQENARNSAYIEVEKGLLGKTSCVYVFVLRKI